MPTSCVKILGTVILGIPRSASSSHTVSHQSLWVASHTHSTFSLSACCRPSRTWISFNRFSTLFKAFVPQFYLHCTNYFAHKSLLNHLNSFCGGMFKLNEIFDADPLHHFECDSHTVHILTQQHLLPPVTTSTVKSSSFTHANNQSTLLGCQVT